jgi:hypothetical protein
LCIAAPHSVAVTRGGRLASAAEMVSLAERASSPEAGAANTPKREKRVARRRSAAVASVSHGEAWRSDSSSSAFIEAARARRQRASRRRERTGRGCGAARALLTERRLRPERSAFRVAPNERGKAGTVREKREM